MAKEFLATVKTMPEAEVQLMYAMIETWKTAHSKLAQVVEEERAARLALTERYFAKGKEGTNRIDVGFGKNLVAKIQINRSVDAGMLQEALANKTITKAQLNELIKFKPELAIKAWKEADVDTKKLFADIVTEKPGMPQLVIDEPKR